MLYYVTRFIDYPYPDWAVVRVEFPEFDPDLPLSSRILLLLLHFQP